MTRHRQRWNGCHAIRVVVLCAVGVLATSVSAQPAAARVNVFVGATVGVPLPDYPIYVASPHVSPPPAYFYAPPAPVYVDYRRPGKYKHKHHWKKHHPKCHPQVYRRNWDYRGYR